MNFLSERNLEMHKEYLNTLVLKYKIFEKSYPSFVGGDVNRILRSKIDSSEKKEGISLLSEIEAHRMFFDSFTANRAVSDRVRREFSSEENFLYTLKNAAGDVKHGFLCVYENKGKICFCTLNNSVEFVKVPNPRLVLDLFEHAYFYDYGFNRNEYIENAISRLNLRKLEKSCI